MSGLMSADRQETRSFGVEPFFGITEAADPRSSVDGVALQFVMPLEDPPESRKTWPRALYTFVDGW